MANKFWPATSITPGVDGSLVEVDGAELSQGDAAFVVLDGQAHCYWLNATLGGEASPPAVLVPEANAGTKRWVRTPFFPDAPADGEKYVRQDAAWVPMVETSAGFLFTASGDGEIHKIDLSTFEKVGEYTALTHGVFHLVADGDYLYAGGKGVVHKIDIDTLELAAELDHTDTRNDITVGLAIGVDHVYASFQTETSRPVHKVQKSDMAIVDAYNYGDDISCLFVGGDDHLYIGGWQWATEVRQIDVSDMSLVASCVFDGPEVLSWYDGHLFIGGRKGSGGFRQVDPADMSTVGNYGDTSGDVWSIEFDGEGIAYVGDANGEVHKVILADLSGDGIYNEAKAIEDNRAVSLALSADGFLYAGFRTSGNLRKIDVTDMSDVDLYDGHSNTLGALVPYAG